MAIANPNPITSSLFNKLWISSITISSELVSIDVRPFDGVNVIGNNSMRRRMVFEVSKDQSSKSLSDSSIANVIRISGSKLTVRCICISECDPNKAISVVVIFEDNSIYEIPDLIALCSSDALILSQYNDILNYASSKIG